MTYAAAVLTAALALAPGPAAACASCVASAYGDRTYNVAYLGLLLAPFALAVVVGAVIAYSSGYRPTLGGLRRPSARDARRGPLAHGTEPHKETT